MESRAGALGTTLLRSGEAVYVSIKSGETVTPRVPISYACAVDLGLTTINSNDAILLGLTEIEAHAVCRQQMQQLVAAGVIVVEPPVPTVTVRDDPASEPYGVGAR